LSNLFCHCIAIGASTGFLFVQVYKHKQLDGPQNVLKERSSLYTDGHHCIQTFYIDIDMYLMLIMSSNAYAFLESIIRKCWISIECHQLYSYHFCTNSCCLPFQAFAM